MYNVRIDLEPNCISAKSIGKFYIPFRTCQLVSTIINGLFLTIIIIRFNLLKSIHDGPDCKNIHLYVSEHNGNQLGAALNASIR